MQCLANFRCPDAKFKAPETAEAQIHSARPFQPKRPRAECRASEIREGRRSLFNSKGSSHPKVPSPLPAPPLTRIISHRLRPGYVGIKIFQIPVLLPILHCPPQKTEHTLIPGCRLLVGASAPVNCLQQSLLSEGGSWGEGDPRAD